MYTNLPTDATSDHKLGIAKAESPELGLSVHELPFSATSADNIDLTKGLRNVPEILPLSFSNQASGDPVNTTDQSASSSGNDLSQAQKAGFSSQIPEKMPVLTSSTKGLTPYHVINAQPRKKDIFDPVETDSDNPRQQPTFKNVRRLKGAAKPVGDIGQASIEVKKKTSSHSEDVQGSANISPNGTHRLESQTSQPKLQKQDVAGENDLLEKKEGLNILRKAIDYCDNEFCSTGESTFQPQMNPVQTQDPSNLPDNVSLVNCTNSAKHPLQRIHDGQSQILQLSEPIRELKNPMKTDHGDSREMAEMVNLSQQSVSMDQLANEMAPRNKPVAEEAQRVVPAEEDKTKEKKPANDKAKKVHLVEDRSNEAKVVRTKEDEVKLDKAQPKKTKQAVRITKKPKPLASEKNKISAEASTRTKAKGKDLENSSRIKPVEEKSLPKKTSIVATQKKVDEDQFSQNGGDNSVGLKAENIEKAKRAEEMPKTSKPMNKVVPKLQSSHKTMDQNSSTPGARRDSDRTRKSMTPAFPESINKIKLGSNNSYRTPLKGLADSEAPLRSSLKRTSSSVRRSISVIDLDTLDVQDSRNVSIPAKKSTQDKGSSSLGKKIAASLIESNLGSGSSKDKAKAPKRTGTKDLHVKKEPIVKKEPVVKMEKTQTKLNNITRDRKMKGRVIDPPIPPKPALQEEIVLSSDSERSVSSYYSDDDTPKPGPSIRRKPISRTPESVAPFKQGLTVFKSGASGNGGQQTSLDTSTKEIGNFTHKRSSLTENTGKSDMKSSPALSGSQISKPEKEHESEAAGSSTRDYSAHREVSSPIESNIDPQILFSTPCPKPSSPRTPAQYMSKPVSITSGSSSDTGSGSGSEDDSTTSATETRLDEVKEGGRGSKKEFQNDNQDAEMTDADAISISRSEPSSQASQDRSASSQSSGRSQSSRVEQKANEQLQRDYLSSIKPSPILKNSTSVKKATPTSHSGVIKELPISSGLRPTSRFTSLTDLKNEKSRRPGNQYVDPKLLASSKLETVSQNTSSGASSSSSNSSGSDDDSSDSPSARTTASFSKAANEKGKNSKPKPHKGVGRLIKVFLLKTYLVYVNCILTTFKLLDPEVPKTMRRTR